LDGDWGKWVDVEDGLKMRYHLHSCCFCLERDRFELTESPDHTADFEGEAEESWLIVCCVTFLLC
jgi:hypothetical protein